MYHLAQLNIARLRYPLDDPRMAEFAAALGPINAIGESTPGFVWRLQDAEGRSSSYALHPFEPDILVNFTVWESLEALRHFSYQSGHSAYFRRRLEWFIPLEMPSTVLWWIPVGSLPTLLEAKQRLDHLWTHGPSDFAFTFKQPFGPLEP